MFSDPNYHFVLQTNHNAIVTKQSKQTFIDNESVGWVVFTPEFEISECPVLQSMNFPAQIHLATYSFVRGNRVVCTSPRQSKCQQTVYLPLKARSNESLFNSFFEIAISLKYFLKFLSSHQKQLTKQFVVNIKGALPPGIFTDEQLTQMYENLSERPFNFDTRIPTTSSSVFSLIIVSLYLNFILFQKALLRFFFGIILSYCVQM